MMIRSFLAIVAAIANGVLLLPAASPRSLELPPASSLDRARHVVLLAGDEEYRSEEALPMLAKILAVHHGFRCSVLFPLDPDGTINPDNIRSLGRPEALDTADVIIMSLRWRDWPDDIMKHFVDAYRRGVPIIALRTSTHAFKPGGGKYQEYVDFGKNVLGETWVEHWGEHKQEATRGVIEPGAGDHPLLRGVNNIYGPTDVYEVYPPDDVTILLRGEVVAGMTPDAPASDRRQVRKSDGQEQPVNEPMMPIAWTRVHHNPAGNVNRILCTTMGAARDLESEGLRRLIVNGVFWALDLEVPGNAKVDYVGAYEPSDFSFGSTVRRGLTPDDYDIR